MQLQVNHHHHHPPQQQQLQQHCSPQRLYLRATVQLCVSPSVSCRWQTHHSWRRSADLRAAQTKNTTGHDGLTFKTSGARCLELDLFGLLWIFLKLKLLLLMLLFLIILTDVNILILAPVGERRHKTHFKLNKQTEPADTFYHWAYEKGLSLTVVGASSWHFSWCEKKKKLSHKHSPSFHPSRVYTTAFYRSVCTNPAGLMCWRWREIFTKDRINNTRQQHVN